VPEGCLGDRLQYLGLWSGPDTRGNAHSSRREVRPERYRSGQSQIALLDLIHALELIEVDRQHLLIPSGTKVLGEAKRVDTFGQTRLAVAFHRLIMPDGYSVRRTNHSCTNMIR